LEAANETKAPFFATRQQMLVQCAYKHGRSGMLLQKGNKIRKVQHTQIIRFMTNISFETLLTWA
jgi:hypothetical protein